MITSADGKVAGPDGSSRSLNGPADLRVLRVLRAAADVVLVGAATARRERYTALHLPEELEDTRGVDQDSRLTLAVVTFTGAVPAEIDRNYALAVTTANSPAAARLRDDWGPHLIIAGEHELDPVALVDDLTDRGLTRVLCEGGPTLGRILLDAGVVDDYCLTTSPHSGGAEEPAAPAVPQGWTLAHHLESGGFSMRRWVAAP